MQLLVVSDTHGDLISFEKVLKSYPQTDMVIHLGDNLRDVLSLVDNFRGLHFEFIRGNNDWMPNYENEKTIEIEGKKVFFCHGHEYAVKMGLSQIEKRAVEVGADVVLFGHTHLSFEKYMGNILFLNPGSLGRPFYPNKASYALLEIIEGHLKSKILSI